jgi:biopolymer transport protein ExbB
MFARLIKKFAVAAAILGAVALSPIAEELPAPVPSVQAAEEAKKGGHVEETSLWDKIKLINPVVTFLLFTGSVVMIWFGLDGFIKTTRGRTAPPVQLEQLKNLFRSGDYNGAFNFAKATNSPLCNVVRAGVSYLPDGKANSEEAMLAELARITAGVMGQANYLSVIAVCAPMVGLCGTVFGMMNAFADLSSSGGGVEALSKSIGEVLVSTALGLIIAIPAFVLYFFLRNRIASATQNIHHVVAQLFRGVNYDAFIGHATGDDEIVAALPNWTAGEGTVDPMLDQQQPPLA